MTARGFFIALPANGRRKHLHAPGCRQTRVRTRRPLWGAQDLRTLRMLERDIYHYWNFTDASCVCMTGRFTEARADAWLNLLEMDRETLARNRAAAKAHVAQMTRQDAWLTQFDGLLESIRDVWGTGAEWAQGLSDEHNHLTVVLSMDDDYRLGWIQMSVQDGDRRVHYTGMNFSTGITREPDRVHRMSRVLHLIEMWRTNIPLRVPPEAPHFRGTL